MIKRIFLGNRRLLPELIAERLLMQNCHAADTAVEIRDLILVLPGQLARKKVTSALIKVAPRGVLLPELLLVSW